MKNAVKKNLKPFIAIILSICIIVGLLPVCGAEKVQAAGSSTTYLDVGKSKGKQISTNNYTYTFPDAEGSGTDVYKGLLIVYTTYISGTVPTIKVSSQKNSNTDNIQFTYEESLSTDYSRIVNFSTGATPATIAKYIRNYLSFTNCTEDIEQEVQFALTKEPIDKKSVFFDGTQHYYQFVEFDGIRNEIKLMRSIAGKMPIKQPKNNPF